MAYIAISEISCNIRFVQTENDIGLQGVKDILCLIDMSNCYKVCRVFDGLLVSNNKTFGFQVASCIGSICSKC